MHKIHNYNVFSAFNVTKKISLMYFCFFFLMFHNDRSRLDTDSRCDIGETNIAAIKP